MYLKLSKDLQLKGVTQRKLNIYSKAGNKKNSSILQNTRFFIRISGFTQAINYFDNNQEF